MARIQAVLILIDLSLGGQVLVLPQSANQLSVSASVSISYNAQSGLYTYSYKVKNSVTSSQEMWLFALELGGDAASGIVNTTSPTGWTLTTSPGEPTLIWAATQVDTVPFDFVDDGSLVPSPYQVKPSQELAGFSFQSPKPPIAVKFYAQGFTQVPAAVDAEDLDGAALKGYKDDSIIGVTQAPMPTNSEAQPSALGLFDFMQITGGAVRRSPVIIGVHFNSSSGIINISSFHATLNGQDITKLFATTGSGSDLSASLDLTTSPLLNGTNFLEGTVSGTPASAPSPGIDISDIRFYVNTTRSLDLNGDGVVNCDDLVIVKASFGRKVGQVGFDPRADVNGDALVDIRDLSAVSKFIPAGYSCH